MKEKKTIKEIFWWGIYLVFLVGAVWSTPRILAYILKTPYPMASITSNSMWPVLKKGDLVLIKGISGKSEIKAGDIIVYKNSPSTDSGPAEGFTIHRVIELNGKTLVTKGDANNISDSPIRYADVIGKSVLFDGKPLRIPALGMISAFINKDKLQ